MYVCMCVCVCVCVCVHACVLACVRACVCVCVCACMHACVCACVNACVCVCRNACVFACMWAIECIRYACMPYAYTCLHVHLNMCSYTHRSFTLSAGLSAKLTISSQVFQIKISRQDIGLSSEWITKWMLSLCHSKIQDAAGWKDVHCTGLKAKPDVA